jgi:hypothetical protein
MELIKDIVDKRENPHTMRDPWSERTRYLVEQWLQQAHERGQDDLHIQQD